MLRSLPRVLVVYDLEVCSSDLQLDSRLRSEECGETKLLPREPLPDDSLDEDVEVSGTFEAGSFTNLASREVGLSTPT